jgi:L,D-peptidoglycan transpeptidase YkuD (ErfK/YbiS/YcfS/YnhG family)
MQYSISVARKNNAQEFAKNDFTECLKLYDSVIKEWKVQNDKWIMKRNYKKLNSLMDQTTEKAIKANKSAIQTSGSLREYVNQNIAELTKRNELFRTKFKNLPLHNKVFKEHSSAHLKLFEAIEASNRGNLVGSYNTLVEAESSFFYIETEAIELIKTYFKSYKQWEKWYAETIKKSRSDGSYAIVVDKMAHKCFLLKNGKILHQYNVELSQKWLGDKYHQGDNATPEGLYHITKKLDSRQTKFNKALLINYPNEEDKKRYQEGVKSGAIPKSVNIGGLIEIHGDGGKGKDWTNGCVALEDKDKNHLYSMVSPGVPVTIVGSIIPLNQLFAN